ncbi:MULTISPECIES: Rho termination factor N-terminal domain-containing protein [unclassified Clostridium]|uniref:Rho termination factor N-terminal domain-containing protein n=1 Tax=unclassified Clostridium TaxID=2614128 RepID=UPI00321642C5
MYEVKFKDDNNYTGEYGPVMFVEGVAKVKDNWIATWFEGRGFIVSKIDNTDIDLSDLTIEQLKEVAIEKGIEISSKAKKDEIITMLEDAE